MSKYIKLMYLYNLNYRGCVHDHELVLLDQEVCSTIGAYLGYGTEIYQEHRINMLWAIMRGEA